MFVINSADDVSDVLFLWVVMPAPTKSQSNALNSSNNVNSPSHWKLAAKVAFATFTMLTDGKSTKLKLQNICVSLMIVWITPMYNVKYSFIQ